VHRYELQREGGVMRHEITNETLVALDGVVATGIIRLEDGLAVFEEVEPLQVLELLGNAAGAWQAFIFLFIMVSPFLVIFDGFLQQSISYYISMCV